MIVYNWPHPCGTKPNGAQFHSKERSRFDERRRALQVYLRATYGQPPPMVLGDVRLYLGLHFDLRGKVDMLNGANFIADCICERNYRPVDRMNLFALLKDDRQIIDVRAMPDRESILIRGSVADYVEFAVVPLESAHVPTRRAKR